MIAKRLLIETVYESLHQDKQKLNMAFVSMQALGMLVF